MANSDILSSYNSLLKKASPFLILVVGLLLFNTRISAQVNVTDSVFRASTQIDTTLQDTVKKVIPPPRHSPTKASILSAVLPGAGQIYNRQYWKAPIIWAGLGISIYNLQKNLKDFKERKAAYVLRSDNDPTNDPEKFKNMNSGTLLENIDVSRKNRDWSYAFTGIFYLLNIVEASVGAHLFYFDVSEDISLNIQPYQFQSTQPAYGLRLALNF